MKRELFIYVIVACLTLAVPFTVYFEVGPKLQTQQETALELAKKYETVAKSIEDGNAKAYIENFPTFLRLQADAERSQSKMYADFSSAAINFIYAVLGIFVLQLALLMTIWRWKKT